MKKKRPSLKQNLTSDPYDHDRLTFIDFINIIDSLDDDVLTQANELNEYRDHPFWTDVSKNMSKLHFLDMGAKYKGNTRNTANNKQFNIPINDSKRVKDFIFIKIDIELYHLTIYNVLETPIKTKNRITYIQSLGIIQKWMGSPKGQMTACFYECNECRECNDSNNDTFVSLDITSDDDSFSIISPSLTSRRR